MSTNVHFSKGTPNEQFLYEDLVIEAIGIYGHDVFYIPRTLVNKDELFGEDALSRFDDAYGIEMWMETQEGYEGEKELVTRFGLEIRDETQFIVSRRRWDNVVSRNDNLITNLRPDEGDLIYFPTVRKIFQINFVDHDDPFFQVDNLPVYKLYCSTFEYSSEILDTGIEGIDVIEDKRSMDELVWQFIGEQSSTTIFNEKIGLGWGTVLATGPGQLMLEDGTTNPNTTGGNVLCQNETGFDAILTEDSDAYYSFFIINEAFSILAQDPLSDNEFLQTRAEVILDFTESNPFGDPTEGT